MDVASGSVLCKMMVTGLLAVTHSVGPGSWKPRLLLP